MHALVLMDELRKHGVDLVFVKGNLVDTPEGGLILYVHGLAGQQERLRFIDRTRTGKAAAARSGAPIGPIKALSDEKRELLSALGEQQRMRDNAAEIRDRIAAYCRQLEPKLANLDFTGKRALLGAFGVRARRAGAM